MGRLAQTLGLAVRNRAPANSENFQSAMQMNLDELVDCLEKHGRRATYGAVGEIVGLPARSVMHGRLKMAKNSWVVAKRGGKPSGYDFEQLDPRLASSPQPFSTSQEVLTWIKSHR